jgi:hypothetical protein
MYYCIRELYKRYTVPGHCTRVVVTRRKSITTFEDDLSKIKSKIGNPGLDSDSTTIVRKRREALPQSCVATTGRYRYKRLARGIHYSQRGAHAMYNNNTYA